CRLSSAFLAARVAASPDGGFRHRMPILSRIEGPRDLKGLSYEQLAELAQDCRDVIISTITKTGGHLASNLGVVELTLALHRAFDSPKDNLVWDTSNKCYTHKLVTGRRS